MGPRSYVFLYLLLEPKWRQARVVQICLPRFASNRHGLELPAHVANEPKSTEKMNQKSQA